MGFEPTNPFGLPVFKTGVIDQAPPHFQIVDLRSANCRAYLPAFNDIGGTFAHSEGRNGCFAKPLLAREGGIEPPRSVLETDGLPISLLPFISRFAICVSTYLRANRDARVCKARGSNTFYPLTCILPFHNP